MGWFLWGVAFGWGVCALYYYNLDGQEQGKVGSAATILFLAFLIAAFVISIGLGVQSGAIGGNMPAPTPTYEGR